MIPTSSIPAHRPLTYYLAPGRAWPAGTSILDDALLETLLLRLSTHGYWFSSADGIDYGVSREMKRYPAQREERQAMLGYRFNAYVDEGRPRAHQHLVRFRGERASRSKAEEAEAHGLAVDRGKALRKQPRRARPGAHRPT